MRTLAAARRPVILADIAALRCGAGPELVRLAELAGIPVVVSAMAKGVFPEHHPYFTHPPWAAGRVFHSSIRGSAGRTTTMWLCSGPDHGNVTSSWFMSRLVWGIAVPLTPINPPYPRH